ncbi:MAG: membrane protein insertase YidC [Gammaproteobacteria bacterium]|nr:membrane protein insertase YidC [Gammaproteobacteria bacterium]
MIEQTRLILLLLLSFLGFLMWDAWQRDYHLPPAPPVTPAAHGTVADLPSTGLTSKPTDPPSVVPESNAHSTPSPGKEIVVTTDVLKVQINLTGAVIDRASLEHYRSDNINDDATFSLLDMSGSRLFIHQSGLKAEGDTPDHYGHFSAASDQFSLTPTSDSLIVPLTWESVAGVTVTKEYRFTRSSYVIEVRYLINNKSTGVWSFHHYEQLQRLNDKPARHLINTFTGAAVSSPDQRYTKYKFSELVEKPVDVNITNGWAAIAEHYFVAAIIPPNDKPYHYYSSIVNGDRYIIGYYGPQQVVQPGGTLTVSNRMYAGPKLQKVLPTVAPGLELTVDYGLLWFIGKILFWILSKLHSIIGNWGWAIIFLTCIVKALFLPLSAAGYRSMAKMRRVQPRLLAIRDRFRDDRPRLNQAMMDLYKEEKINPLGGCLPIVVQIPVFISLYWVILESVELRQAPWILWVHDLSLKDPFFVLPFLMTISMWLQSKLNPAPLDPIQAKVMQIMPFAFGIFFAFFPAGLVLYWFVNNVLSITQQWFITRSIEKA